MGKVVPISEPVAAPELPYFLTEEDTRRHGVDIGEAVQAGMLTLDDFRAVLAYCRACPDGHALRETPGHDRSAAETPPWCANRVVLEGLRGIV